MIISLDTETTGIDLAHGAAPFLVTWCEPGEGPCFIEWDVDPITRKPNVLPEDVAHITELLDSADTIYLHNAKFDARALANIGINLPWSKVRDTLIASHLLSTNTPHNLTYLCGEYLHVDIEPHELHIKKVTQECRSIVKQLYPNWLIADEGIPGMPSVSISSKRDEDKPWKNDMWLPRALTLAHNSPDPKWTDACSRYACADSEHTIYLGIELEKRIREQGLWAIYEHRLHLPRVDCEMECYGITARGDYTKNSILQYELHIVEIEEALIAIAKEYGHNLELAEGASINDNMRDFFYGAIWQECPSCHMTKRIKHWNGESPSSDALCTKCASRKRKPVNVTLQTRRRDNLALPNITSKKTGNASLDADAMRDYKAMLEGTALEFVELLADKRMYDTAITYMKAYRRYWLPASRYYPDYYRIHPFINPCGTDHLRQSSNSPNCQNVSGESKELSNRACFGPLPSREWWSMDFKSIEARIPAYESREPALVEIFDNPDSPPYWGSQYNLVASILFPDKYSPYANESGAFKKYEPKYYKRAKFFVLARNYGAGKRKGDSLAGFSGASDMVESGLPLLSALQAKYLRFAERMGYVETLPDKTVDPMRGYPIMASRTNEGRVLSTTPFNYHISGTACWCKNIAMIRCSDRCAEWREHGFDAHMTLEVHDELLFDFPRGKTMEENLPRAMELMEIMKQTGSNLIPSIPTPISVKYHTESWEEGIVVI